MSPAGLVPQAPTRASIVKVKTFTLAVKNRVHLSPNAEAAYRPMIGPRVHEERLDECVQYD